jgi:hypothetical protein
MWLALRPVGIIGYHHAGNSPENVYNGLKVVQGARNRTRGNLGLLDAVESTWTDKRDNPFGTMMVPHVHDTHG